MSPLLGTYVAFKSESLGVNIPVPFVDQIPPIAFNTPPFRDIPAISAQTVWSELAKATGISVKVIRTSSEYALHNPLPVVVKVSVIVPAAVSAADGM